MPTIQKIEQLYRILSQKVVPTIYACKERHTRKVDTVGMENHINLAMATT